MEKEFEEAQMEETDSGEAKMPGAPGQNSGEGCMRRENVKCVEY